MKKSPSKPTKQVDSGLKKEIKQDVIIVSLFLAVVSLAVGWRQWIMPSLTSAFAGDPNLREVNSLLMIVGSLVIVCLLLITVLFMVLRKIRNLTKKLDSWELLIIRDAPLTTKSTTPVETEEIVEATVEPETEDVISEKTDEPEVEEPERNTPEKEEGQKSD